MDGGAESPPMGPENPCWPSPSWGPPPPPPTAPTDDTVLQGITWGLEKALSLTPHHTSKFLLLKTPRKPLRTSWFSMRMKRNKIRVESAQLAERRRWVGKMKQCHEDGQVSSLRRGGGGVLLWVRKKRLSVPVTTEPADLCRWSSLSTPHCAFLPLFSTPLLPFFLPIPLSPSLLLFLSPAPAADLNAHGWDKASFSPFVNCK